MTRLDLIDAFTEWVLERLQAKDELAPKSVQSENSWAANRTIATSIPVVSPGIFTEAQKSTAQLTH